MNNTEKRRLLHKTAELETVEAERKQTEEARLTRIKQLANLNDLSRTCSNTVQDRQKTAVEILRAAQMIIPEVAGSIWQRNGKEEAHMVASVGLSDPQGGKNLKFQAGQGMMDIATTARQAVASRNMTRDLGYVNKVWAKAEGLVSCLMLPLIHNEKVMGGLSIFTRVPHDFSQEEKARLESLAIHAAIAIENTRLSKQSEDREKRLETLVNVAQRLTKGLDLTTVINSVAEAAADVFEGEAGFRILKGNYLVRVATTSGARNVMKRKRIRLGESLSGSAAASGQVAVSTDLAADKGYISEHRQHVQAETTGAGMIVPVKVGSHVLGTLHIFREQGYHFTQEAIRIASSLADQSAIAIENARLFEKVQKQSLKLAQTNKELKNEIKERRRAEDALKALNLTLEQRVAKRSAVAEQRALELARSNVYLEQFAFVASHNLQEPLRKALTFGSKLQAKYGEVLTGKGRDYLVRMQKSVEWMQALVSDLFTFSQMTRKRKLFVPVDLAELILEVISDLKPSIEQTKGRVEMGALPIIEADRLHMRLLFRNLIGNALKYRKKEKPPVVKIKSTAGNKYVKNEKGHGPNGEFFKITVTDNGLGFEEQHADQIFDIFKRLHSQNQYEGTGMGLALSRIIVEQHGGNITAKGRPGQGATFVVTLPTKQANKESNRSECSP